MRHYKITKCNSDTLYADLLYVNPEDTNIIKRYWKSEEFNRVKFEKGWMLPHPTFFVKKEIYNKFGLYSDKLKSAADYEMILRLLYKNNVTTTYLNKITVKMRDGGYSNQSFWSRIQGNKEDIKSWEMNNLKAPTFLRIRKPLSKISQYIKKPKKNENLFLTIFLGGPMDQIRRKEPLLRLPRSRVPKLMRGKDAECLLQILMEMERMN